MTPAKAALAILAFAAGAVLSAGEKGQEPLRLAAEPRKLHHVEPAYPPEAWTKGRDGDVAFDCQVDPSGRVVQLRWTMQTKGFLDAAREAVQQWRYEPLDAARNRIFSVVVRFRVPDKPIRHASVTELIEALQGADLEASMASSREMLDRGRAVVPELLAALDEADDQRSGRILSVLASLGREAREATPRLVSIIGVPKRRDGTLSPLVGDAAEALVSIDVALALRLLREAVRSSDAALCTGIAGALDDEGEGVQGLVAALALPGCREAALESLQLCEDQSALEPLLSLVGDERASVRRGAWEAIAYLASSAAGRDRDRAARRLLPAIGHALGDPDDGVREAAAEAVEDLGAHGVKLTQALAARLDDPSLRVQTHAARALASFGLAARSTGPRIRRAIEALGSVSAQSPGSLTQGLASDLATLRRELEAALKAVGYDRSDAQLAEEEEIYEAVLVEALAPTTRRRGFAVTLASHPPSKALAGRLRKRGITLVASGKADNADAFCAVGAVSGVQGTLFTSRSRSATGLLTLGARPIRSRK